ncbi:hypothetical protein GCM10023194_27840 [Planotetraspora phitsanulokensis]|uniref:Phosphatidic acid phosphatase type 2/haloperoxidase domain-containing protein n=1 Tax=Planotetraspora phitsanulokensis TaxID=575192 RepID=A0A8J3XD40_9ACTN|nr:phosphatase PAP2 family protein [Planotetraspora phitsanulokensis]GII36079.1 hypothetical protein Pph01_10820 [Planotetraspora phitsanulokensis]
MKDLARRRTQPEIQIIVGCVFLLVATAMGFLACSTGWTTQDMRISTDIQALRMPWLTGAALVLNLACDTVGGIIILVVLTTALMLTGRRVDAVRSLVVVVAGWGISTILKIVVARPRPANPHALLGKLGDSSFPSGHVALTLSLVIALALLIRRRWMIVVGAVVVLAQMFARVYLGAHYLSDTVGSLIAAPAAIAIALALVRTRALAGQRVDPARRAPACELPSVDRTGQDPIAE